jgi:hypothetical protein
MTNLQERILEIFKDLKTSKNGVQKPQSFDSKIRLWDRRSQDEAEQAIADLITDNYMSVNESWYVLTEKGYNYIYRDYSIEDTEEIILDIVRNHKVGVGNIIIQNWFTSTQQSADRFHFDNFNKALQNIIDKDFLENTEQGLKLTSSGYEKIY